MNHVNFIRGALFCGLVISAPSLLSAQVGGGVSPGPAAGAAVNTPGATAAPYNPDIVSRAPWFSDSAIRRELQISREQHDRMHREYSKAWRDYNESVNKISPKLSEEARAQQLGILTEKFHNGYNNAIASSLADTPSKTRYMQLYRQYRGYDAFDDPVVQSELNLTAQQRDQINRYDSQWDNQMRTWARAYREEHEMTTRNFSNGYSQIQPRIYSTLTPAQRKIWDNMTGKPFQFRATSYIGAGDPSAPNGLPSNAEVGPPESFDSNPSDTPTPSGND